MRFDEIQEALKRRLGIPSAQAAAILAAAQFTILIDDVSGSAGDPTGGGGRNSAGLAALGGTALEFVHAQILNPEDSGVLVMIDQLVAGNGANQGIIGLWEFDTPLTTEQDTKIFVDRREPGAPAAQMRAVSQVALLGTTQFSQLRLAADVAILVPFVKPIILGPGQGAMARSGQANTTLEANWFWREINLTGAP